MSMKSHRDRCGQREILRDSIGSASLRPAGPEAFRRRRRRSRKLWPVPPQFAPPSGYSRISARFHLSRGEGMWSWVAHRITGVLTFFFLFAHVLDTALVRVSPESYDKVIDTYKNPVVNLGEVGPGRRRALPRAQRHPDHDGRLLGQGPAVPAADALDRRAVGSS